MPCKFSRNCFPELHGSLREWGRVVPSQWTEGWVRQPIKQLLSYMELIIGACRPGPTRAMPRLLVNLMSLT